MIYCIILSHTLPLSILNFIILLNYFKSKSFMNNTFLFPAFLDVYMKFNSQI